mmetsp:Transcript_8245/g.18837  ORF Transcript_8245/g.18837 Transcript_8245/m.18837 type:complete len:80 (+) Transcript_8245:2-241(+)
MNRCSRKSNRTATPCARKAEGMQNIKVRASPISHPGRPYCISRLQVAGDGHTSPNAALPAASKVVQVTAQAVRSAAEGS